MANGSVSSSPMHSVKRATNMKQVVHLHRPSDCGRYVRRSLDLLSQGREPSVCTPRSSVLVICLGGDYACANTILLV